MKNEHPCGARRECRRRALRSPRGTTANRAARRECESPIGPPCGTLHKYRRRTPETPAAQPQPPWHGGSVEGSRRAHADGGTRHRASSHRWHRAIFPWRGVGSRGATVGRPSAHCSSPGRHSGPRSSPPDRAPPRAHPPQPWAPPHERSEQPVRGKAHPPQAPTHRAPPRAHPTQPRAPTAWATAPPARGRANQGDPRALSPSMRAQPP